MNLFKFYILILFVFLICGSCNKQSKKLKEALIKAGENSTELEIVLEHFKGHKLKYKAARFLIENMGNKYSTGEPCYTAYKDTIIKYYQDVDSLEKDR